MCILTRLSIAFSLGALFAAPAFALVTADGAVNLLSGDGALGYYRVTPYYYVGDYVNDPSSADFGTTVSSSGSTPVSLGDSNASGSYSSWNSGSNFTFSLAAESPSPSSVMTTASADFFVSTYVPSFYGSLGDFGFEYDFSGYKDDNGNQLSFGIQMEIYYLTPVENSSPIKTVVYTDYDPSHTTYQKNIAYFFNVDNGTYSGSINYAAYDVADIDEWYFRLDVMGNTRDFSGSSASVEQPDPDPAPVPEPSTLLLLVGGLVSLGLYARKEKKEWHKK